MSARTLYGAPEGYDAYCAAAIARESGCALWIARDDGRLASARAALAFFAPDLDIITIPAFDCLPYDRISPAPAIAAARAEGLAQTLSPPDGAARLVLTTIASALQKTPPVEANASRHLDLREGDKIAIAELRRFLEQNGFSAAELAMNTGDYAVRGALVDIFPPGMTNPVRLDFFGDVIERIRLFDPLTQRTRGGQSALQVFPASEIEHSPQAHERFCRRYAARFGAAGALYSSMREGRRFAGMEHWLPLFYDKTATLFSYLPRAEILLDDGLQAEQKRRQELIAQCYQARQDTPHPAGALLAPEECHTDAQNWEESLAARQCHQFRAQLPPRGGEDAGGRSGRNFTPERVAQKGDLFTAISQHSARLQQAGKRVVIAGWSTGSCQRLARLFAEHKAGALHEMASWQEIENLPPAQLALAVLPLAEGFEGKDFAVISEQDIFGQRLAGTPARRARAQAIAALRQARTLEAGELVVHIDHGIGRFEGLQKITAAGGEHDCLLIMYADDRRLFLPVENCDLVSRYGEASDEVALDRLGASAWQTRRAQIKKRLMEMAGELVALAAKRLTNQAAIIEKPAGIYEEFCARFPYEETEDQKQALEAVFADMASGKAMDRLICGDVGFGKTELALRAALCAALAGKQVALIAPTTLLARQHGESFRARFMGFPVRIGILSRLTPTPAAQKVRDELAAGTLDIVIGTHALLKKSVRFKNLGLLIVDEEQHFGVAHKEQLKEMGAAIHVLTLSATPIPRSLQMALSGARDISLIATPPAGRLPVKLFAGVFDPPALRAALIREHERGGQSFFVCPRVRDLERAGQFLREHTPELRVVSAYGKLPPAALEERMTGFYEGRADVLLSTNIVESGLDIPRANTMIVYRAHMFGLAQLHQLRGRVGRSPAPAYAWFTVPHDDIMASPAGERLKVLQSLNALGSGFSLAARDLDMRGAGNLLGAAQSGHIREVGYELYQKMLHDALAHRKGKKPDTADSDWSPSITIGLAALIPESYAASAKMRLTLYRELIALQSAQDIESFAASLIDRFGALPQETENLLDIVRLKIMCRRASVARLDAGQNGLVLRFHKNHFANPAGLAELLQQPEKHLSLRPDHHLVQRAALAHPAARLDAARDLLADLLEVLHDKAA